MQNLPQNGNFSRRRTSLRVFSENSVSVK